MIDSREIEALQCDLFSWQRYRRTLKEYEGCARVCVCLRAWALHNKLRKWHQMSEVKYVCFSKHGCHLGMDERGSTFSHISSTVFCYTMSSMTRNTVCTERATGVKTRHSYLYLMMHTSGFASVFFSSLANWLLFIVWHRDLIHYIKTSSMLIKWLNIRIWVKNFAQAFDSTPILKWKTISTIIHIDLHK